MWLTFQICNLFNGAQQKEEVIIKRFLGLIWELGNELT